MSLLSFYDEELIEAGCDEAGRGCLAGPVYAAAVILPKDYQSHLLNDSKLLNEAHRYTLREEIEREAINWAVAKVDHEEIDRINILQASFKAMHLAIAQLRPKPELLLIDGNRFNRYRTTPHKCIVKGDSKFLSIAAASILAKTYRDDFMNELHAKYPKYQWHKNKGYPTKEHRTAIQAYGQTPLHRQSFKLLGENVQGQLF